MYSNGKILRTHIPVHSGMVYPVEGVTGICSPPPTQKKKKKQFDVPEKKWQTKQAHRF